MNDIYIQFAVYHIMHDRAISDLQFRQVWDAVNRPLQNATPGDTLINHCAYIIHTNG